MGPDLGPEQHKMKSSHVTFIHIALLTIQIVSKATAQYQNR